MSKIKVRGGFLLLASLLMAQGRPADKTSIAVYPLKAVGKVDKAIAASLTSLLNYELAQSSRLIVIDESQLQEVMKRQAMNISDLCDDTTCQVEIGKLVQAQKMAAGDLIQMGSFYILTVKVIDIQKGTIETTTKDRCSCSEDQLELLVVAAGAKIRNYFGEAVAIQQLPTTKQPPEPPRINDPSPPEPVGCHSGKVLLFENFDSSPLNSIPINWGGTSDPQWKEGLVTGEKSKSPPPQCAINRAEIFRHLSTVVLAQDRPLCRQCLVLCHQLPSQP